MSQPESESSYGDPCRQPDLIAMSAIEVDIEAIAEKFELSYDYVDEVEVAGAILRYERYAEKLGVFDAVTTIMQMWKSGSLRFEGTTLGDDAAIDILYYLDRHGERFPAAARTELFARVKSSRFRESWLALTEAIRACLCSCTESDGLCGGAPVEAVIIAGQRMHSVLGRAIGEYERQSVRELSCATNDCFRLLESEVVTEANPLGSTIADTLEWFDQLAGRPTRDYFGELAIARAIGAIFAWVANPSVDTSDPQDVARYRTMIERSSVLFPADPCGSGSQAKATTMVGAD